VKKTAIAYACAAALCVVITNVYALFGHGVRSVSMDTMFAYPLAGGAAFLVLCLCLKKRETDRGFRFGFNAYSSGIATLTCGALLTGIVEIAGTGSDLIRFFFIAGYGLCGLGVAAVLISAGSSRSSRSGARARPG
ncbi:MAG: hypothetical protein LBR00_03295, partial [Clostridiales Family XIII bacterium]|nr:hypothetical protein [Clostridiales Family XIII bacterium]